MKNLLLVFVLIFTLSCRDDDDEKDYTAENDAQILAYIADNNLNAQTSGSGLYYVVDSIGNGAQPLSNSDVIVYYKGYFTTGQVFEESQSDGISVNLQGVIKGWTEGITYFKEGGTGTLLIPSRLGYGNEGNDRIPGGAVILFDIKLLSVN